VYVGVLGGEKVAASKPRGRPKSVPPPERRGRVDLRASSVDSRVSKASHKQDSAAAEAILRQVPPSESKLRSKRIVARRSLLKLPSLMIVFQITRERPHLLRSRSRQRRRNRMRIRLIRTRRRI
jgi:hypothetical protein